MIYGAIDQCVRCSGVVKREFDELDELEAFALIGGFSSRSRGYVLCNDCFGLYETLEAEHRILINTAKTNASTALQEFISGV